MKFYIPHFCYKDSGQILNEINYEVVEGKVNFLVGHNGVGKTTLIDLFLELKDTRDSIRDYTINNDYMYVNQLLPMLESVYCRELIRLILGIIYHKPIDLEFIKKQVNSDIYNIFKNFWDKKYSVLSIGEKKNLQIFSFIQSDKKVIVLNEPAAFMDRYHTSILFDYINTSANKTYIIITHDYRDLKLANDYYITFLDGGSIVAFENKVDFESKKDTEGFLKYFKTLNEVN